LPFAATPHTAELVHRDVRTLPVDLADRHLAVVGGGEAAIDSALTLAARGARATVLCRGVEAKAPRWLVSEALDRGVAFRHDCTVVAALRTRDGLRLLATSGHADTEIAAHEVLVAIGRQPNRALFDQLCPGAAAPADIVGPRPGLFLAGDLIRGHDRFAAIATGDGQRAARAALAFLRGSRS
jgi:thioredoxin reductase (NADPH)